MASSSTLDALRQELVVATRTREAAEKEELALKQAIAVLSGEAILITDETRHDFDGLGIVEAAKRLIRETGVPMGTKDIADQILKRGVVTVSKNYVPTVYSTLDNSPEFTRVGGAGRKGKWDLIKG